MSNKILVVGSSSKVGRYVVPQLVEQGEAVKAATRDPGNGSPVAGSGAELVRFDYDDPASFGPALAGVDRVFLVARSADPAPHLVINPFVDAAREAGVRRIVFMTAMGVDADEEIGLRKAERHVQESGVGYVLIRPTWFDQNFNLGFIAESIKGGGGIFVPAGDARTAFVDARDIAGVAVAALTEDGHEGKIYTLTGPTAVSYAEAARAIATVSGHEVVYHALTEDQARAGMAEQGWQPPQIEFMLALFQAVRAGYTAQTTPDVELVLGRTATSFDAFVRDHAGDWQ